METKNLIILTQEETTKAKACFNYIATELQLKAEHTADDKRKKDLQSVSNFYFELSKKF